LKRRTSDEKKNPSPITKTTHLVYKDFLQLKSKSPEQLISTKHMLLMNPP
jgi:hypothetical protein